MLQQPELPVQITSYEIKVITVLPDHCKCVRAKLLQSCPTLWDPKDCSLPGSSDHGILQIRILEWVAISFSKVCTFENVHNKMCRKKPGLEGLHLSNTLA